MTQPTIQQAMEAAVVHHQAGRLDQAEQIYRQVLSVEPNHPDALHLMGIVASHTGRENLALQLIGKAIVLNPAAASYHLNLGVALDRLGRLDEAIVEFEKALAIKPNYPQAFCNLGNSLGKKGLAQEAIAASRRAIAIWPGLSEAHNNLGNALLQAGQPAEAVAALRRAVELRPNYAEGYANLAKALLAQNQIEPSIAAGRKAIELRPGFVEAHNNLANALAAAGQWTQARESFERAIELSPNFALGHFNLAAMLLLQGDLERGWDEYEWRFRVPEFGPQFKSTQPRWDGSSLAGRKILLHAEQGLGDVIQFARYLPRIAELGGKMIVRCDRGLHRLLAGIAPIEQFITLDEQSPEHDTHCSIISLPHIFRTNLADIPADVPYISADSQESARWRNRIGNKPRRKIGLVWAGRSAHARDKDRSIPPKELAVLEKAPDVRWFSLQKEKIGRTPVSLELTDWTKELNDFADTAALIDNLDLVITVDTAAAHLAGAMGKTVWVMLPFFPDWRWMLDRSDSPWYPTVRLFRRKQAGGWNSVLQQIVEALIE